MVSNKKRLYMALYPSGIANDDQRKYHWAFLIGPKVEKKAPVPGMRYHVKNLPVQGWVYEEATSPDTPSAVNLLARIVIAKVADEKRLVDIFRETPVVQGDASWRCRTWIANALSRVAKDGRAVGTAQLDWETIESLARDYVARKTAAGRYLQVEDMVRPKPTWDMLRGKEIATYMYLLRRP